MLDSVSVQEAASDWDSEGVAESLQAVRESLSALCSIAEDHLKKDAKRVASDSADSKRLLSAILQLPQEQGCCNALQPSGIFAAVGALLGIQAPLQGLAASTAPTADLGGNMKRPVSAPSAQRKDAAAAKAPDQESGGTDVPGYIAAVVAGPSVAGFAQHCWDALEGASSGDCPFVGAREYAVLEAFDKCAFSLTELYERLAELHAHFLHADVGDANTTPSPTLFEPPSHLPFLRSTANSRV